jgi:hypothetical protein
MGNPAEGATITRTIALKRKRAPASRLPATPADYVLRCRWPETLVPVGDDLFGLLYLLIQTGKVKFHFPGSSRDQNLNGRQTVPLHSHMELFVSFLNSMMLETIHG